MGQPEKSQHLRQARLFQLLFFLHKPITQSSDARMISIVLYGRNDSYGYNLHKRAALSLNCMAEVLTNPADEILFVDYNTPDDFPTFPEAIQDTLTKRARARKMLVAMDDQKDSCPLSERHVQITHPFEPRLLYPTELRGLGLQGQPASTGAHQRLISLANTNHQQFFGLLTFEPLKFSQRKLGSFDGSRSFGF